MSQVAGTSAEAISQASDAMRLNASREITLTTNDDTLGMVAVVISAQAADVARLPRHACAAAALYRLAAIVDRWRGRDDLADDMDARAAAQSAIAALQPAILP